MAVVLDVIGLSGFGVGVEEQVNVVFLQTESVGKLLSSWGKERYLSC